MIALFRCDDRMIHGQCIVRILGNFGIERIIGVDDFTAANPVLKSIYKMAVPPQINGDILSTTEAVEMIREHLASQEKTLLLVKNPQTALLLFQMVDGLPKALNIGPMSSRKDTTKITLYAYLTDEEIASINTMASMNIRVYFNQISGQKTEEWDRVKTLLPGRFFR